MFRVYTGKDGKPADYSPDNIPLKPRHYLPISLDGIKQDEFTMVFGFPGNAGYLTAAARRISLAYRTIEPRTAKDSGKEIGTSDEGGYLDASAAVRIQYASKYAQISNYWKYFTSARLRV